MPLKTVMIHPRSSFESAILSPKPTSPDYGTSGYAWLLSLVASSPEEGERHRPDDNVRHNWEVVGLE